MMAMPVLSFGMAEHCLRWLSHALILINGRLPGHQRATTLIWINPPPPNMVLDLTIEEKREARRR